MSIETALYQYLASCTALTALVGTRIDPMVAPQGTARPCLVYFKVSDSRRHSHQGFAGLCETLMQISVFADRYETDGSVIGVKEVAAQVTAAMEAWEGASGIQAVFPSGEQDIYDGDTGIYHIPMEFTIWHSLG